MDVTATKELKSPESDWISNGDWITEKEHPGHDGLSVKFFEYRGMSDDHPGHVYAHPITPGTKTLVHRGVNILLEWTKYRKVTLEEKSEIITRHINGHATDYIFVAQADGGWSS